MTKEVFNDSKKSQTAKSWPKLCCEYWRNSAWEPSRCTCTLLLVNDTQSSCSIHALSLPHLSLFNLGLFNLAQYQWNWVDYRLDSLNSFTTVLNRWRNRITISWWGLITSKQNVQSLFYLHLISFSLQTPDWFGSQNALIASCACVCERVSFNCWALSLCKYNRALGP